MAKAPFATPTTRLVAELVEDTRQFIAAEIDLASAELGEIGGRLSHGVASLVGGAALLLAGLLVLLAALSAFLVRLGLPLDAACFMVAASTILIGWLLVRSGQRAFQPGLAPARSLAQISSLLGRR